MVRFVKYSSSFLFGSLSLMSVAVAQEPPGRPSLSGLGVSIGTLGLGGEISYLAYDKLVLRGAASYIDLGDERLIDVDDDYNFSMKALFVGVLADWHPFADGFRVTAGIRYADIQFDNHDFDGMTIGNNPYSSAQVGAVHTTITNSNPAAPYFGIGYDASHFRNDGSNMSLSIEVGALYAGDPDVNIRTDMTTPALPADIALEKIELSDELDTFYRFYPVIMISGRIMF